mmetsp:Transcript_11952/g.16171  ORF Transcript_11952/g.16171 Transcript_11952/m.16171 type:complete len:376 (+) Transcript_11952:131-1258(+)
MGRRSVDQRLILLLCVIELFRQQEVKGNEDCERIWPSPAARRNIIDVFRGFEELKKRKTKSLALFCGSGPSMNLIDTKGKANLLEKYFDVWGTNQLFLHNVLRPQFMHIEIKPQSKYIWDTYFFKDPAKLKQYEKTTFIADDHYPSGVAVLRTIAAMEEQKEKQEEGQSSESQKIIKPRVFVYNSIKMVQLEAIGGCDEKDGHHLPNRCGPFIKKCSASGSVVLQFLALLEYDAVCIIGMDLITHSHFWTHNPVYPKHLQQFQPKVTAPPNSFAGNKVIQKQQAAILSNSTSSFIHATALRGFHLYLQSFLKSNNIQSLNFSPHSAHIFGAIPHVALPAFAHCTRRAATFNSPTDILACAIWSHKGNRNNDWRRR